jgi:hypothetical protein
MIAGRRMRRRLPVLVLVLAGAVVLFGALGFVTRGLTFVTRRVEAWTLRPRVLAGGDSFETVTVTERASTRQTGEFDGEPGDDLAIVEYGTLQLLTPATLAERRRLELGGDLRSRWKPSFRLARLGGALVVVDTGGGLDETRVRDLDGTERWRYRPDTDIPATSLAPADLDADGDAEFYATITSNAVRLDANGQETWRAPFSVGRIVATAPRTHRDPAWVVAEGQGEMVVWDGSGARLAGLTMKDARPLAVIDWSDGRYVLAGGSAVRAIALDGRVAFEWTVPGMTVSGARPLSLAAGAPPAVALVASGPGERNRWRLQIVSREGVLLYDERLDTAPELLTARGADGVDRLFLDRASLLALRKRSP